MCGIAGFAGSTFSQENLQAYIRHACKALRHRGPDQEGVFVDKSLALGVTRLAVRDPKNGIQPMTRQGMTLIYNGELYDTKVLKEKLLSAGYRFETNSDTEILLNAFLEFGLSIVTELSGMFAFALWDSKNKTLSLGRDRWGEKPLYYAFGDGFLAFASEIKGLRAWPNLSWDIDLEDIRVFLKNSYLPNPRTGWRNVFKLKQGTVLIWQEAKLTAKKYFSPLNGKRKLEEIVPISRANPSPEELFYLLDTSVKSCLVADRPVGAFLSGGIDSTTVACLLARHQSNLTAFSLSWDEPDYSEELYSREAAQAFGLKHQIVKCDSSFLLNNFDTIVNLYDEPFADESIVPTYCLAHHAKQTVDVVLTGDGADEFFHGYERYFFQGAFEKYLDLFSATSNGLLKLICHPSFMGDGEESAPFLEHYSCGKPYFRESRLRSWVDINTYLTDNILMKVDTACMGVSLEARAPFLLPQVTDFALSCSIEQLVGKGVQGKEILRSAMKNHLPKLVVERKKMGFGVPIHGWFQSSLKEWMAQRLFEGALLKTGWFSRKGFERLASAQANHSRTLFNLLVLEVWIRKNL